MRAYIRRLGPAVLAFLCLLCAAQAFLYAGEGKERDTIRTLKLEKPYSAQEAVKIQRTQKTQFQEINDSAQGTEACSSFAIWGEQAQTPVSSPKMNRSTNAVLVTVCGDSGLVLQSSHELGNTGDVANSKEYTQCLVSPALAQVLFGHEDATGQVLEAQGREYSAAGILCCEDPAILVTAQGNPEAALDRVSFETEGQSVQEAVQRLEAHTGIQGAILPVHLYRVCAGVVSYLAPVLLYLLFCAELFAAVKRCRRLPISRIWAAYAAILVMVLAGAGIFHIQMELPRDMLPTMWSDFDFWSELWQKKLQEISLLIKTEKSQMELSLIYNLIKTAGFSALSMILGVLVYRKLKIKNAVIFWTMLVCALLVTYFYLVLNMQSTAGLVENRILWWLLPACFTMRALSQVYTYNTDTEK